ncbi:uncharacterized protein LOC108109664 [Drosophila eugracilis]|uniref:uncharacterized protein LOC108109664 n=1 Tax=Drosophila eugracilis TaxID=29029 RepID=UPI0007E7F7F3|nr:uncharacterized protein LOC108109664 [Drosophila eugracilis]
MNLRMNNQCENNDTGSSVAEGATTLSNGLSATAPSGDQTVGSSSSTVVLLNDDESKDVVPKGKAFNGGGSTNEVPKDDSNGDDFKDVLPKSDASNGPTVAVPIDNDSNVGGSKDISPKGNASDGDVLRTDGSKTSGSESGDDEAGKTTAKPSSGEGVSRSTQNQTGNYNPDSEPSPAKKTRQDLPPGAIELFIKSLAEEIKRGDKAQADNGEDVPQIEVDQRE